MISQEPARLHLWDDCLIMRRFAPLLLLFLCVAYSAEPVYMALLSGVGDLVYLSPSARVLSSVSAGQRPREMALSPDRRYLYITGGDNTVTIVDILSRRRIGDIPIPDHRRPQGVAVHPKTGLVAVVTESPARLLLIDPVRRSVVKQFATNGQEPAFVTFGREGSWAYVSNTQSGTLAAIDTASGETATIRVGDHPQASVLSADGKELYVLNRDSGNIAVVDTSKRQVIANIITGKGPTRGVLAPGGDTLAYTLSHERKLAFASVKQRRAGDYVIVPGDPVTCSLSNDGQSVLVATRTGSIYIVSIANRKITGEIKTDSGSTIGALVQMPESPQ